MQVLIPEEAIRDRIRELAARVNADYHDRPFIVVGILTGSLIFLADLVRQLEHRHQIGLLQASSYRGTATTAGTLELNTGLLPEVNGRHVLLLDDILDTGATISRVVQHLQSLGAASVKTCVLLRKLGRQTIPFEPDYFGFEIPDAFVVGYGLDFNDDFRHLPFIAVLPAETSV